MGTGGQQNIHGTDVQSALGEAESSRMESYGHMTLPTPVPQEDEETRKVSEVDWGEL